MLSCPNPHKAEVTECLSSKSLLFVQGVQGLGPYHCWWYMLRPL